MTYPTSDDLTDLLSKYNVSYEVHLVNVLVSYDLNEGCQNQTEDKDPFYYPWNEEQHFLVEENLPALSLGTNRIKFQTEARTIRVANCRTQKSPIYEVNFNAMEEPLDVKEQLASLIGLDQYKALVYPDLQSPSWVKSYDDTKITAQLHFISIATQKRSGFNSMNISFLQ